MRCGPTRASASCSRMTAMTAPFRYRRLSYVVLDVADIDRSLAFYRDLVGLAVDRRQGDVVYLRCSELPQNLILRRGDTPGLARAAFELESRADLESAFSYLQRSEEHTSELQSLLRISYAVFCLKQKKIKKRTD